MLTKQELCAEIMRLIDPDTADDGEETTDGEILDMIYELAKENAK